MNETYLSPAEFWAGIEDLAPFSEDEIRSISGELINPQYLGSDDHCISVGNSDYEANCLDQEDLSELIGVLSKWREEGVDKVEVVLGQFYHYDEKSGDKITFSKKRNLNKFSAERGKEVRKRIIKNREIKKKEEEKQNQKIQKEKLTNELLRKFQSGELEKEKFLTELAKLQVGG